jgi:hypothetical protein
MREIDESLLQAGTAGSPSAAFIGSPSAQPIASSAVH